MPKWVYQFNSSNCEGTVSQKPLLGGKGANLAEMGKLGLPVPPGFTITTEVCTEYNLLGQEVEFNKRVPQIDGAFRVNLDMSAMSSGVYVIRMGAQATTSSKTARIIVK